jgi:sigma-B regulation protein RsbU (phosphoserine phosphatase)
MDVSGHGAGAALHSVAVMNLLRQRALPATDMADPGSVLTTLNGMFQMDRHAEMYFTMWYGVFDRRTHRIAYGSAGHHPSYMVGRDRVELIPLRTKNGLIGAMPGKTYVGDSVAVPPGASVYMFSDGVFEIVTKHGLQWSLQEFLPLILKPPVEGLTECQRIFRDVTSVARPGGFDDDFSFVALTFD